MQAVVGRVAGVAARAAVRAAERLCRRRVLMTVTRGITSLAVPPSPAIRHTAAELNLVRVADALSRLAVFVGVVVVGCHIAHAVEQRRYWRRHRDSDDVYVAARTLATGDVAAWLRAWEADRVNPRD